MPVALLKFTTVRVTSVYGWRTLTMSGLRNFHEGVDTWTGGNYPHSAFGAGVVVESPQKVKHWKYGWYIRIQHAPGIETSHHSLNGRAMFKVGQRVRMGDIIGFAGTSALAASGPHVHNALWLDGKHVDPLRYLRPGVAVTVAIHEMKPVPGGTTAGGTVTPIPEDDMSAEAESQINSIFNAIFRGGESMPDGKKSIGQSLADIRDLTSAPINRDKGDGKGTQAISVRQDNADTNTMVRRLTVELAGLRSALTAVSAGKGADPAAIQEAARLGAAEALKSLKLSVEVD